MFFGEFDKLATMKGSANIGGRRRAGAARAGLAGAAPPRGGARACACRGRPRPGAGAAGVRGRAALGPRLGWRRALVRLAYQGSRALLASRRSMP